MSRLKLAVILGSGLGRLFPLMHPQRIKTSFGVVATYATKIGGEEVILLPRHGFQHTVPPHRVDNRANIQALRQVGVEKAVATAAVGSMNPDLKPGDFVIPDQFLDFTKTRKYTFFDGEDGKVVHIDMTMPYDTTIRRALLKAGRSLRLVTHMGGTYVCTEGPRFETAGEIRMFRKLGGDVVGMTGVPEVVLAREAGLGYATLCTVTNWAAGIQRKITQEEVLSLMKRLKPSVRRLVEETVEILQANSHT